jgi:dTDP-glucose pyrophosphorylase/predicted transcriptional regulator
MNDINNILLKQNSSIREALYIIDSGAKRIALIVDEEQKLIGTLSDGDVRRGLLRSLTLDDSIESIIYKTPTICHIDDTKEKMLEIAIENDLYQIPIIDENGQLIGIETIDELLRPTIKTNKVVLMVGGLGTRLRPLTNDTPKPMLHVGGKPILQTIVEKFSNYGFINIVMCIGYKSDIIQNYFGDGSKFGVKIEYILEEKRMGTAGALSLLSKDNRSTEPFFVMNGDLLTNVNFENLLEFHLANKSVATMCVREYDFQVPYGVVNIENGKIRQIEEKPIHKFFVSAGIYMLDTECIDIIPEGKFYDMPTLFEELINMQKTAISFPLREYWLDIGRIEEYERANSEYKEVFR